MVIRRNALILEEINNMNINDFNKTELKRINTLVHHFIKSVVNLNKSKICDNIAKEVKAGESEKHRHNALLTTLKNLNYHDVIKILHWIIRHRLQIPECKKCHYWISNRQRYLMNRYINNFQKSSNDADITYLFNCVKKKKLNA